MKFRLFMPVMLVFAWVFPMTVYGQDGGSQVEEKLYNFDDMLQDGGSQVEEKLYNFDDMLIDGAFRDPQGMFERARAEAEFEGVLKLERSFLPRVELSAQELSMRP